MTGIWIMSYDKETIVFTSKIRLISAGVSTPDKYFIFDESENTLGYYSKARALELMSDIQRHIAYFLDCPEENPYMFLMPKE